MTDTPPTHTFSADLIDRVRAAVSAVDHRNFNPGPGTIRPLGDGIASACATVREDDADRPPQDGVGALSLRGWHIWRCEQTLTDGLLWRPILDLRTVWLVYDAPMPVRCAWWQVWIWLPSLLRAGGTWAR